jgi:menaquinone-dependent protoporphyrinogen IX oxidase
VVTTEKEDSRGRKRVLVAYASKSGSTARIAQWMAEGIEDADAEARPVAEVKALDYDLVILGAPVRVGRIHPDMVAFLEKNRERLSGVPKALFVVCLLTLLARRYLRRFKSHMEGDVAAYRVFGGKLGFIGRLDREYAVEAGRNIALQVLP